MLKRSKSRKFMMHEAFDKEEQELMYIAENGEFRSLSAEEKTEISALVHALRYCDFKR